MKHFISQGSLVMAARGIAIIMLTTMAGCVTERVAPAYPSAQVHDGAPPYRLYVPQIAQKDPASKRPLVVVLHGCLQTADAMAQLTKMNEEADRAGFFVLYPDQAKGRHPMNCWMWFDPANRKHQGGELKTILNMVDEVKKEHPIDPAGVYVAGLSSGGATAAALLACHPKEFAGGALVASPAFGVASDEKSAQVAMGEKPSKKKLAQESCQPNEFKGPVLIVAGTKDRTVNPGHASLLAEQFASPEERKQANLASWHLIYPGELSSITACYGKPSRVCRVLVDGLGHAWSGGHLFSFSEPRGPSTAELVRRFIVEKEAPKRVESRTKK